MKKLVFCIFLFSLFLVGCNNIGENPNADGLFFVSGTLVVGYESEAYPRSAFPANLDDISGYTTDFYYYKQGETLAIDDAHKCGITTSSSFTIKIPAFGDYYIYAQSYKTASSADPVIEYTTKNDAPLSLTAENPYSDSLELLLTPVFIGTGTITLPVKVGKDSSDNPLAEYLVVSKDGTEIGTYTFTSAAPSATFSQNNYPSGVYDMTFSFYDDSSKTKLLYQCIEKITVLSEKTTDTWINSGNAEYFTEIDGALTMFIDKACIENFALTNFYVGTTSLGSTPSDTNSGNYFAPFETLEHAITKINSLSTAKTYTVHISNVTVSAGITISNNVNIVPTDTIDRATITRKASGSFDIFTISAGSTVKIENIDIDGNKGNSATGIGINNSGNLSLVGTKISNCNNSSESGGGIYNAGTFTMSGGEISGNTATNNGGGVYVASGTFTMTSGTISSNTANSTSYGGGGVYVYNGTFEMTAGTISENTASGNGGGVYVYGTVKISGAAHIPVGDDGKNDVYLPDGKYITITGALTGTTPVATIKPYSYAENTQVLDLSAIAEASRADTCGKFALSDPTLGFAIAPDSTDSAKGVLAIKFIPASGIEIEIPNFTGYTATLTPSSSPLTFGGSVTLTLKKNSAEVTPSSCTMELYTSDDLATPITTSSATSITIPSYLSALGNKNFKVRIVAYDAGVLILDGYYDITVE